MINILKISQTVFENIDILCLGLYKVYYFPEHTTYDALFREIVSINC
jgi:hypothetical protein